MKLQVKATRQWKQTRRKIYNFQSRTKKLQQSWSFRIKRVSFFEFNIGFSVPILRSG